MPPQGTDAVRFESSWAYHCRIRRQLAKLWNAQHLQDTHAVSIAAYLALNLRARGWDKAARPPAARSAIRHVIESNCGRSRVRRYRSQRAAAARSRRLAVAPSGTQGPLPVNLAGGASNCPGKSLIDALDNSTRHAP